VKTAGHFQTVLGCLQEIGFLLESDAKLPSVCSLVTGETMRGSWWSHPSAQSIFQINERLEDHEDVLITKLVSGKVTFVHRVIWSEVVAIGRAREAWQLKQLPAAAKSLLDEIETKGSVTTAEISWPRSAEMKLGDAARTLEKRLLIVGTQFHSESGAHQRHLETWGHWLKRRKFNPAKISATTAKAKLEMKLKSLNDRFAGSGKLSWQ
jgi:hypothetical protein